MINESEYGKKWSLYCMVSFPILTRVAVYFIRFPEMFALIASGEMTALVPILHI